MKNKLSVLIGIGIAALVFFSMFLSGCAGSKEVNKKLSVQVTDWHEMGSTHYDPEIFTPLKKGDVVYESLHAIITVKSVNEERIVLKVDGGMVEPNPDGTIDLNKEPIGTVTLSSGQSIELDSQSMSAGVNVTISF